MKQEQFYINFLPLVVLVFFFAQPIKAQSPSKEKPLSVEICFAHTHIMGDLFPGMSGHYIYFLSERLGTGLSLSSFQRQIDQDFGYSYINPQLLMSEYGWINQFILMKNNIIKFKINLSNGLLQLRLMDESRRYYSGQLLLQQSTQRAFYYFIQPSVDLSLHLFGPLFFTGGLNYRYVFGKARFSNRTDLQGSGLSLGITMMNNKSI